MSEVFLSELEDVHLEPFFFLKCEIMNKQTTTATVIKRVWSANIGIVLVFC